MSVHRVTTLTGRLDRNRAVLKRLGVAGFNVTNVEPSSGGLQCVQRNGRRVWVDMGWTMQVVGDESDRDEKLFYEVVSLINELF